ncbi:MAG: FRG domain-containing protein [Halopseudomonas sabulinigri]
MSDTYSWNKVPFWDSGSPESSFDILADDISGRIPITRLESWQDFVGMLESSFFNPPETELVFRGHRRFDWSMTPTLGRISDNGIITSRLADETLALFRKAIRGRITDHSLLEHGLEDDELWSIGQHHGLMTPLLDQCHQLKPPMPQKASSPGFGLTAAIDFHCTPSVCLVGQRC